nr:hypothetical protein HUO10_000981 [Paraburkholderia busanensis]
MYPSSTVLLNQLHQQSTIETMTRARSQFIGTTDEFIVLADQYNELAPRLRGKFLRDHGLSSDDAETSQGTSMSLAVSAEMGRFLRNIALSNRASRILELGSSYGVSTLYFADALRSLGGGTVIATELDAAKCARLREHVRIAGVDAYVDLREGDVFDTLARLDGSFDIVFIDAWADAYLRLFREVERFLRPGSIVLADNMYTAEDAVQDYKGYIENHPRFTTTTLDFESGVEFTVALG